MNYIKQKKTIQKISLKLYHGEFSLVKGFYRVNFEIRILNNAL